MPPITLPIYALTLEAAAWAAVAQAPASDGILLVYFLVHGGASALIAAFASGLVPTRLVRSRLPLGVLVFAVNFALPLLGLLATGAALFFLHRLRPMVRTGNLRALQVPDVDPHQRAGTGFRQAGLSSFLSNARAPESSRLRALVALQSVPNKVATPLLRGVLADPSEDLRLLAYGMLDSAEKRLNTAIHEELAAYRSTTTDPAARLRAARRLADLYWELVYADLVQGDLRQYALGESLRYTGEVLAATPGEAAMHLRHGRLLQSLGEANGAADAYGKARRFGLPATRITPYLAELAYDRGDFAGAYRLMAELADWQTLPRLSPVVRYWNPQ